MQCVLPRSTISHLLRSDLLEWQHLSDRQNETEQTGEEGSVLGRPLEPVEVMSDGVDDSKAKVIPDGKAVPTPFMAL